MVYSQNSDDIHKWLKKIIIIKNYLLWLQMRILQYGPISVKLFIIRFLVNLTLSVITFFGSFFKIMILNILDFPGGSDRKVSAYNAGDLGSIPGSGRFPGEGNGNPLQYSCLENPMDGGTWQATAHGVAKSQT